MGNLVWHEYARLVAVAANVYAVWASFFGLFYRKFFWDFVGGTVRDPGGIQPSPNAAVFITIIVKAPIVQILALILGLFIIALEFPLPQLRKFAIHRSIILRIVLLLFQTFLTILFYQFDNAIKTGDVFFFPSVITKQEESNVEFEIRLCPALQKKTDSPPNGPNTGNVANSNDADQDHKAKRSKDPFAQPYIPNLHVGDLIHKSGEEYVVLLNKYAVIPQHFLLITKEFQSQSSPLMPPDLVQIYSLLIAAKGTAQNLFAFYNCGNYSGASQPHKHIQFIPVEDDGPPIERLAKNMNLETPDKPFSITDLPYVNYVFRFPTQLKSSTPEKMEEILSKIYLLLLDLCISTIRHDPTYPTGKPSYNVLISSEHIHLIPRRKDTHTLRETGELLSINALGYAGMLLVRSDTELEAVKAEGVRKVLQSVSLSVHDLHIVGTSGEGE
ncbi:hypothetical protein BDZ94DRAFT_1291436 [Collybia nuda]|uniref:ATP adenylyltransferase n=1 Tax=Collybia nuda TaxID=64659 RepID=A0A9P6CGA5_9AGAR|nr:hypothetical protein BDZ94DRAFT_1291436 [Collybia nuda]